MHTSAASCTIRGGTRFVALLFCFFTLVMVERARAETFISYDLDSLVYLSSDIVEAQVVGNYSAQEQTPAEIKVSVVHKGACQPGQLLAVNGLNLYEVPDEKTRKQMLPRIGDKFIFFLTKSKALSSNPPNALIYSPVPSGLKLLRDDKVMSFSQQSNPGLYITQLYKTTLTTITYPGLQKTHTQISLFLTPVTFPTLKDTRAEIRASLAKTNTWAAQLRKPATTAQLMQILRERPRQAGYSQFDAIAEAVCKQLADRHNPDILLKAVSLNRSEHCLPILASGFATPAGREALLQQIGDAKAPLEQRMVYTRLLKDAGAVYQEVYTGQRWASMGKNQKPNAEYLTRIAYLIQRNQQHEKLCLLLVQNLAYLLRHSKQYEDVTLQADAQSALSVLETVYNTTKSEQWKYQMEMIFNSGEGRAAYDQLNAPGGAVISIVTIPDPPQYTRPTDFKLLFTYNISILEQPIEPPSLVFSNQETGKTWLISAGIQGSGGGSKSVILPPDLPHGSYHVYLQFTRDGKVVSNGHLRKRHYKPLASEFEYV